MSPIHHQFVILSMLLCIVSVNLMAATSATYGTSPETLDSGGGATTSGTYRHWATSIGGLASTSVASSAYDNRSAYVAQLGAAGTIQLAAASYNVQENAGTLLIPVMRIGGSDGAVSLSYSFASGTATPGTDFTPTNGVITFSDGDTATKFITMTIVNDAILEGNETTIVTIANATGGALIGAIPSAVITIIETSTPPPSGPRPRIVSDAQLWAVSGQSWTYDVLVDVSSLQIGHALSQRFSLTFALLAAPTGVTITKTGDTSARVSWPNTSGSGQHTRIVITATDITTRSSDQQDILLYVVNVPSAGG